MKNLLLLLNLFFIGTTLVAQSQGAEPLQHKQRSKSVELGANATQFFSLFQRDDSTQYQQLVAQYPTLLCLTANLEKLSLYGGIGGEYRLQEASEFGFADLNSTQQKGIFAQLGIAYRMYTNSKMRTQIGFDATYQTKVHKTISDSGIDKITVVNQSRWLGFGPKMVIQYWPTRHFGVGTHLAAYFRFGNQEAARIFTNFPELNDNQFLTKITDLQIIPPANLFLYFNLFQ